MNDVGKSLTLTAAVWFLLVHFAVVRDPSVTSPTLPSQTLTTLSLPPLASISPSALHSSPHTSPVCPSSSITLWRGALTSWCHMLPSPHPELRVCECHESSATCPWCPVMVRNFCLVSTSHSSTSPFPVPIPRNIPSLENWRDATYESSGASVSGSTEPVSACHRYVLVSRATATVFKQDQLSRLR